MNALKRTLPVLACALLILLSTGARRISKKHLAGEWWLDAKADSIDFFKADTLRFTNLTAMPVFGGCYGNELIKHRPVLGIGTNFDLQKDHFYIGLEKDTVYEKDLEFYGVFTSSNSDRFIEFDFRKDESASKIGIENFEKWFTRRYYILSFSEEKLVLVKE